MAANRRREVHGERTGGETMWRTRMSIVGIAAGCLLFLSLAPPAAAQCSLGSNYNGIALRAANPFQAERTTTFTHETQGRLIPSERPPGLVARDSQGRIRVEMTMGKFKVEAGEAAGTEAVQHIITICDPVSQKLVRMDSLAKTATIMSRGPGALRGGIQPHGGMQIQRAYCAVFAPVPGVSALQREDLGRQTIEGWDAQGVRSTRPLHALLNSEGTAGTSTSETWCSEELGVMLLQVTQATGSAQTKMELKLTKIVLGGPNPALFQIPPDYRVVERVPEERRPGQMGTFPTGSTIQVPVPVPVEAPPQ
jgi:hypothetical protein